ncbi:hypothetical protein EPUS_01846 [Endocarpon pusillum Z07020]|uniref:Protein arginine methyltransferase NDUFAF7 n=1 Tax=Endocarpon pusillum (strain Z07020 / HMAS-L-300199) TaxID=1263415 RepID=U1FXB0_ENDPU|nr:uncharacterized protein EPUS_01846 [Endocarpon pusillum Z07020]ERF69517.1 hypothetical protein EPUS_01846 [Endocarpon pusillum Z07020]
MRNGAIPLSRRIAATQAGRPPRQIKLHLLQLRWSSTTVGSRSWSTPLAKTIAEAIEATGPISIAAYMRQCLTSPQGGYYTTTRAETSSDQFGSKGDFITSPEICQVFGELVAIWFVTEWMAQGRRRGGVQLIEVGPGRGTLMDDMLRTIATFKELAASIEGVYLVEAGDGLREKQRRVLCGDNQEMVKTQMGWRCVSRYEGIPVFWVQDINLLPKDEEKAKMPFIIAHEFFDALPIHAFESQHPASETEAKTSSSLVDSAGKRLLAPTRRSTSTSVPSSSSTTPRTNNQWRELLVTPTPKPSSASPLSTQAEIDSTPEFQLALSKTSTRSSLLLPESSPRYQALKSQAGSSIEISPDSLRYIADFARRIGGEKRAPNNVNRSERTTTPITSPPPGSKISSGAALIIDYGPSSTVPLNSLRGIKNHKRVSPFSEPGLVDLSADVDFTALAEGAVQASGGVEVWGPVEQGDFLGALGGAERVGMLIQGLEKGVDVGRSGRGGGLEEKKRVLMGSWKRLVEKGGGGMGRIYKVLAILPEAGGKRVPVGFGGGVEGS